MSLCEARNSTTFPFSFLIGTMSNKHQKGDPERKWTKVFVKRSNADNEFYNFPAFITLYIGKRGSCPNLILVPSKRARESTKLKEIAKPLCESITTNADNLKGF